MNYQTRLGLVLALVTAAVPAKLHATVERVEISRRDANRSVLRISELRSAYLIRAGAVHYEATDISPQDIQHQLRRHFDVVLALLITATPTSIDTALNRLERSSGDHWSEAERKRCAQYLLNQRFIQLVRLTAYRDRGVFPRNKRESGDPTPIFVDNHDTACAVGHLMQLSGWEREVESIRLNNNRVYVLDSATGSIARWILTSGLTIEEAALIQPAYNFYPTQPPEIPADAIDLTNSSWSGIVGDLRLSNFKLIANPDTTSPAVNIPVTHTFCTGLMSCSIVSRIDVFSSPVQTLQLSTPQPIQSNLDAADFLQPQPPNPFDVFENLARAVIQFDVETVSPMQRIVLRPYAYSLRTWPGEPIPYARNELSLFVNGDRDRLLLDHGADDLEPPAYDEPGYLRIGSSTIISDEIEPVSKMTIVTDMLFMSGRTHEAQLLHFDVTTIPEPGSISVVVLASMIVLARFRTRRRVILLPRRN